MSVNQTKKCKFCRSEMDLDDTICPICRKKQNSKFNSKTMRIIGGVFLVLFVIAGISNMFGGDAKDNTANTTPKTPIVNDPVKETPKDVIGHFEATFGAGYYTASIDFPAGTYTITAISGKGNVSSSNIFSGGLNEMMGVGEPDYYITEFKNAKLPKGTVLSISSEVILKISSENAVLSGLTKRTNSLTKTVTFSSGHYEAGVDFEVGVYDVIVISGKGNVSSSNIFSGGINEMMGIGDSKWYLTKFKNVELEKTVTLDVSGVKIQLVPSK